MIRFFLIGSIVIALVSCGSSRETRSSSVNAAGTCVKMHLENQCNNQTVCRLACGAAGSAASASVGASAGGSAGVGAAVAACNKGCDELPECSQVSVCDRWSHDPY